MKMRGIITVFLFMLFSWVSFAQMPDAATVRDFFTRQKSANLHPRLFFTLQDIDRIKKGKATGDTIYTMGTRQVLREANVVLNTPLLTYYLDDAKLRVPSVHKFATQVTVLVMSYHLTGDYRYAQRVWQQLDSMGTWPDWGQNRHFLDAGIGAFNLALAYDGLYQFFSENQRKQLRQTAHKFVLDDGYAQMKSSKWWHTIRNNWNGICNGGMVMLSLALYNSNPEWYSQTISLALSQIPRYLETFEPDGQSEEGLMYWSYGINYTLLMFEVLNRGLGSNFGLADTRAMRKTGWFPVLMSGPAVGLSIGDDPLKKDKSRSFFWFAAYQRDTALAAISRSLAIETGSLAWHDLIHYNAPMAIAQDGSISAPLAQYIRGIEYASLRTDWSNKAMFAGMHGGHNNASHGHLDAGSFDIQALGETWALGNLGRDDYTYPGYFSKETYPRYLDSPASQDTAGRWHFFRLRAESKNTVVVRPDTRPEQDPMGEAIWIGSPAKTGKNRFVINLQPCYHRDLTFYERSLELDTAKNQILIFDTLLCREKVPFWWSMFTPASITLLQGGRQALLQQNGKSMLAEILYPTGAVFTSLPATYLPGQAFPLTRNSPNPGITRLAIHQASISSIYLLVRLRPI